MTDVQRHEAALRDVAIQGQVFEVRARVHRRHIESFGVMMAICALTVFHRGLYAFGGAVLSVIILIANSRNALFCAIWGGYATDNLNLLLRGAGRVFGVYALAALSVSACFAFDGFFALEDQSAALAAAKTAAPGERERHLVAAADALSAAYTCGGLATVLSVRAAVVLYEWRRTRGLQIETDPGVD